MRRSRSAWRSWRSPQRGFAAPTWDFRHRQRGLAMPTRSLRATFCSTSCSGEHGAQDGTWRAGNPHGAAQPPQPAALVRYLYEGGRAHWAPARKHAWLAPAACLYQVEHVIRRGLSRNASMSELVTDARSAQEDIDLLKRLEVTRM